MLEKVHDSRLFPDDFEKTELSKISSGFSVSIVMLWTESQLPEGSNFQGDLYLNLIDKDEFLWGGEKE